MAGKPFKVGRFAHTLRVRLMREHLGVDVDALSEEHLMVHEPAKDMKTSDPTVLQMEQGLGGPKLGSPVRHGNIGLILQDAENEVVQGQFIRCGLRVVKRQFLGSRTRGSGS